MASSSGKKRERPALDWRTLAPGRPWGDQRLTDYRFNEYAYEAPEASGREQWEARCEWVRRRVLLSAGLWPMKKRCPLNARVWGEIEREGCRIAKVRFESRRGYYVTGNLYRPLDIPGRAPAVLCPHGHAPQGRFTDEPWFSIPARCVMLARLGFVAFSYDMIGYNDDRQTIHRWPLDMLREAALYGVSPFGLQTWNSIRAVDFVSALPDVDEERLGCTGASGGASQTWNLGVVDDRIKALAPVCMLSSHYQGGCVCEEGPLLRLDSMTTLDMVGALAPRPVFLVSVTGDWSSLNPDFEVPALRSIYALFGAADRVGHYHFDAGHNYSQRARERVYAWFLRWLMDDKRVGRRVPESKMAAPPVDKMRIVAPGKPDPTEERTRGVLQRMYRRATEPFDRAPDSAAALRRFRAEYAGPYAETLGARRNPKDVAARVVGVHERADGLTVYRKVLSRRGVGDVIPAVWLVPDAAKRSEPVNLVVCGRGKQELFNDSGPGALLKALLSRGRRTLAVDALGLGETRKILERFPPATDEPLHYCFNPSVLAMRVQDILTCLSALAQIEKARTVHLWATGEGARAALLALPLARKVGAAFLDLRGVRRDPAAWRAEAYHPLILKMGELKTAAALAAPRPLFLNRPDPGLTRWARQVYEAAGKPENLRIERGGRTTMTAWACG